MRRIRGSWGPMGFVNHFYFYPGRRLGAVLTEDLLLCPLQRQLCLNGHTWAQRQCARAGIGYTALDNGFAAVEHPAALQTICDRLGEEQFFALMRKRRTLLPLPLTRADRAAGYVYELAFRQFEILDDPGVGPARGRAVLVRTVTTLLGCPYTSRQATYDLRRLKRKGLIVRLPGHHRYQLTPLGRRVAVLFTKVYGRVLAPGLAELDPRLPTDLAHRSELAHAWRQLDQHLNQFTQRSAHRSLNPKLGLIVNSALTKLS